MINTVSILNLGFRVLIYTTETSLLMRLIFARKQPIINDSFLNHVYLFIYECKNYPERRVELTIWSNQSIMDAHLTLWFIQNVSITYPVKLKSIQKQSWITTKVHSQTIVSYQIDKSGDKIDWNSVDSLHPLHQFWIIIIISIILYYLLTSLKLNMCT